MSIKKDNAKAYGDALLISAAFSDIRKDAGSGVNYDPRLLDAIEVAQGDITRAISSIQKTFDLAK